MSIWFQQAWIRLKPNPFLCVFQVFLWWIGVPMETGFQGSKSWDTCGLPNGWSKTSILMVRMATGNDFLMAMTWFSYYDWGLGTFPLWTLVIFWQLLTKSWAWVSTMIGDQLGKPENCGGYYVLVLFGPPGFSLNVRLFAPKLLPSYYS